MTGIAGVAGHPYQSRALNVTPEFLWEFILVMRQHFVERPSVYIGNLFNSVRCPIVHDSVFCANKNIRYLTQKLHHCLEGTITCSISRQMQTRTGNNNYYEKHSSE